MAITITRKKAQRRKKLHLGIRKKIRGSAEKPRLSVFRSNRDIYAQLIDDNSGHTLLGASSKDKSFSFKKENKVERAKQVGVALAKMAADKGIKNVVFDRGGYLYHGRVKALAEGAREGGLDF